MKSRQQGPGEEPVKPSFFSTQVSQARRFFLNLNPGDSNALVVVSGGIEHCAPNYLIDRSSFPFYSIEYVARGEGRVRLGDRDHQLQTGSVFAYGPGIPHCIRTDPKQPLSKYFIDFAGREAARLLKNCRLKPGCLSQVYPPLEIQPLFDELIRSGLRGARQTPQICGTLLQALALKILESHAPLRGRETLAFATYQQCRQHLLDHFRRLRSVEQAAAECHLNDAYLCRLFKRYDHETPYRFLIRLKMNYAAERLHSGAVLVKQVAAETGFLSQFHFSRAFKSVFGIPPSQLIRMR